MPQGLLRDQPQPQLHHQHKGSQAQQGTYPPLPTSSYSHQPDCRPVRHIRKLVLQTIKATGIRPVRQKGRSYYLQSDVQPIFQRRNDERWLLDKWSTVAELSAESGLSPKYIRELIRIHRIPKKKAGRSIIVSYRHWTDLRELEPLLKREYITAFKARAHYHATSDTVCRAIREHNIPKLRHGNSVYYKLSDLDKYLLNRK